MNEVIRRFRFLLALGVEVETPCVACKHYKGRGVCRAFPKGIPKEIFTGLSSHTLPIKGQKGKFVFEARK